MLPYAELLSSRAKRRKLGKLGNCKFRSLASFLEVTKPLPHSHSNFPSAIHHPIAAIGDVHADMEKLLRALKVAGAIDSSCSWAPTRANPLTVVITGDLLDQGGREDDSGPVKTDETNERVELDIIQYLFALDACARKTRSGRVHVTIGNHEIDNFRGDFWSATPVTNRGWGGVRGRKKAFKRGGPLSILIAHSWPMILCLGKIVFTHAGLSLPDDTEKYADFPSFVEGVNGFVRDFLTDPSIESLPLWVEDLTQTRAVSDQFIGTFVQCARFAKEVLEPLHATDKVLVVGHTPQLVAWAGVKEDGINGVCDDTIWRIDVAMSKAFGSSSLVVGVEVLRILPNGEFTILRG